MVVGRMSVPGFPVPNRLARHAAQFRQFALGEFARLTPRFYELPGCVHSSIISI